MTITINGTTGISGVNGSAGTPSLQGQDTNTGFFYGTDILGFSTGGSERMRIDASGNLGLGVTPSAWGGGFVAFEGNGFGLASSDALSLHLASNAYRSSSAWTYKGTGLATRYRQNAGQHEWYNAPSGTAGNPITFTQAMTLDASGNLGIGTTSPLTTLSVSGSSGITMQRSTDNAFGGVLDYLKSRGSAASPTNVQNGDSLYLQRVAPYSGGFTYLNSHNIAVDGAFTSGQNPPTRHEFYTNAANGSSTERMRIDSSGNVTIGSNKYIGFDTNGKYIPEDGSVGGALYTAGGFRFFTGGATERMRIDSSGNLLVGTTTVGNWASNCWGVQGNFTVTGHVTGTASGTAYAYFDYNNGVIGSITQNGTTAVAYNTSSDYRLKENIQPMQNALGVVQQLNPVTYTWKADGSDGQGFIAHELQAVCPDAVTGTKDAVDEDGNPMYQGVDTSFLVATLTKAIQELTARIEKLEAK